MKYSDVFNAYAVLNEVSNKVLPRKISVAIVRNISALKPIIEVIDAQRTEIANKYGDKNEDGTLKITYAENGSARITFHDNESNYKLYIEENEALDNVEEDVTIVKVPASELDKCEFGNYDAITPKQEIALAFMLTYDEE